MGLGMQHVSEGVAFTDVIDGSKWLCCHKYKNTYHLECVTQEKVENITFPCAPLMNAGSKGIRQAANSRPEMSNQGGNISVTMVTEKQTKLH